jgi:FkbM family methyltransferase
VKERYGWAFPDADEFMMNELSPDGTYQGANLAAALTYVTDWTVAIDGGSHIGTWSVPLARRFARVIAVEPCRDTFEALTLNLMRQGATNVEPVCVALGEKAHEVSMTLDGRGAAMKNTGARRVDKSKRSEGARVPCQPIDEWHLPSLGLLKLDVEGSEVDALLGAEATIVRCRPVVLYEDKGLWVTLGRRRDAAEQIMLRLGYALVTRVSCDVIWCPR